MIVLAVLVIGVVSTRGARYVVDPRYGRSAEDALPRRKRLTRATSRKAESAAE